MLRGHLFSFLHLKAFICGNVPLLLLQAHLQRHLVIHKRTENYNPRQRKLRNVVIQEVDGSPDQGEATESVEAQQSRDHAPVLPTTPQPDSPPGLDPGSSSSVVVESGGLAGKEAVTDQKEEGFSESETSQLIGEEYENSAVLEEMVEDLSESKT